MQRRFPRGYAKNTLERNYFNEAYRNLEQQAPNLQGIVFQVQEYSQLTIPNNAVIYLDPPYANTKQYGYKNQGNMDYNHFWNWVREISKNNYVFISEQSAPNDFEKIWTLDVKRTVSKDNNFKAIENLFKIKK